MNRLKLGLLPIAFAASMLVVGIRYWAVPYQRLNLPDALIGPGLLVIAVSAALIRATGSASFGRAIAVVGAAAPAAVLARVGVEVARDPTTHNLWPFEFFIASVLGVLCALAGALMGALAGRVIASGKEIR